MKQHLLKFSVLAAFAFVVHSGNAQPWMSKFTDSIRPNFFDIQHAFTDYWAAKGMNDSMINRNNMDDDEGGDFGEYIQYKRWEWFNARRVSTSGEFPDPMIAYTERNKLKNAPQLKSLRSLSANWTCVGPVAIPNKGGEGRLNCLAINPLNPNTIYVGSPSGGLWKTNNGGNTWTPTSDYLSTLGVTDIAIDPTDTNIIYIATGDGDVIYTYSTGVMKSLDGGATWATTGLNWQTSQGLYMNRIVINPGNHNMLLVGNYNGVSKSRDGGATWTNPLTGHRIYDIQFKPGNPAVVYASGFKTIYRSVDSGSTFTTIYSTLAANRIELAVTPANANYLYALESDSATSGFHALIRSIDGGNTFTQMSNTPNILDWSPLGMGAGGQGWADLALIASPTLANTIVIGGINVWVSTDGGTTWANKTNGSSIHSSPHYIHADIHRLAFMPGSSSTIFAANDGGLFKSTDTATTWTDLSAGLTIAEIYDISSAQTNTAFVSCGAQDNGSDLYNNGPWSEDVQGDAMMTIVDYTNDSIIYTAQFDGKLSLSTNAGANFTVITPNSGNVTGAWVTPFVIDKNAHATLYGGYNDVWKTTDQGTNWAKISNNLTGNSTELIMAMAISPSNSNYLYVALGPNTGYNNIPGTSVYATTNGGGTWTNITGSLPIAFAYISAITVKSDDPKTVWVTFSGYNSSYKIYKTTNGGSTWTNVTANLPNVPVDCIVYDQTSSTQRVFIGTDIGVFYTDSTQSGSWTYFNTGMPDVMVFSLDIQVNAGLLRAGTFGRGLWQTQITAAACPTITAVATQIGSSPTAYASASGGAGPYTYKWNTAPYQTTDTATGLTAGSTYTVTATDQNACTGSATVTISAASCPTISATITQIGATDYVYASPSGGTSPYTYRWNTTPTQTTDTATGLAVGSTYTVIVTDHNGCTGSASVSVDSCAISLTAIQVGNSSSAYALASGGTSPYTYIWSNHATTDTTTSITSGSYSVTATDHNGCTGTATVSISVSSGTMSIDGITKFTIYPNPSTGAFTISLYLTTISDVTVSITDMTGQKIYQSTEYGVKELNKPINPDTVSAGIYFVNVRTTQGSANQRIVIK